MPQFATGCQNAREEVKRNSSAPPAPRQAWPVAFLRTVFCFVMSLGASGMPSQYGSARRGKTLLTSAVFAVPLCETQSTAARLLSQATYRLRSRCVSGARLLWANLSVTVGGSAAEM